MISDTTDLSGLPQKSNDLLSFYGCHNLTYSFKEIVKSLVSIPPTFTIRTKNNEFKCHIEIIATVSHKILKKIESNPQIAEFSLQNDFDDSKFDQIADFLNGIPIKITDQNRQYIEYVFQSLEISQTYFKLNSQNELSLNSFSQLFHNVISKIDNPIIITNANAVKYSFNYLIASTYCHILENNNNTITKQLYIDASTDFSDVSYFLNGHNLNINFENIKTIKECFSQLQITIFDSVIKTIESIYELLKPVVSTINLQDTIFDIKEEKIDNIYNLLKESDYFTKPNLHDHLLLALEISFIYRPRYFQSVIHLIELLNNDSNIFHSSLITYLKNRHISSLLTIPFLRSIYDNKIITLAEVLEIIKTEIAPFNFDYSIIEQQSFMKTSILLFFASELIDDDEEKFMNELKEQNKYQSNPKLNQLNEYLGKWSEYSELMHLYRRPGNLCAAIYDDDVDMLQEISSHQANFDFNQILSPSIFEPFKEIDCDVSLADLAAFYGSVRCFKFLILQHVDLSNCSKFAIYGGNSEIIRLIEQEGNKFDGLLYCAVHYHRYDIYKWLLLNYGSTSDIYEFEYRTGKQPLLPLSIKAYNHRVFLNIYEKGIDNSKVKNESISLFGIATIALNIRALKLLSLTFQVDVNCFTSKILVSPLYYATACNSIEAVKIIAESKNCLIPKDTKKNPLFIAAEKGEIEIVKYLSLLYKDVINEQYLKPLKDVDQKMKDIILSNCT